MSEHIDNMFELLAKCDKKIFMRELSPRTHHNLQSGASPYNSSKVYTYIQGRSQTFDRGV